MKWWREQESLHNRFVISCCTDVGPTRNENQDVIVLDGMLGSGARSYLSYSYPLGSKVLVAVIDGMGGYDGGRDAAFVAASDLTGTSLSSAEDADAVFSRVSRKVKRAGIAWETPQMGAACAALFTTTQGIVVANIGDCRIYLAQDSLFTQLSVDDRNPQTGALTQALGYDKNVDAHGLPCPIEDKDLRFVMCSDGVWGTLSADEMKGECTKDAHPRDVVYSIQELCRTKQARDNCSLAVVDVCKA